MTRDAFRPMLAATCEDMEDVRLPVMASAKLDGFRCVIRNGVPLSRTLKPIPNRYVREKLTGLPPLDGELIVGNPVAKDVWNVTSSGIGSENGEPDFTYYVFDVLPDETRACFLRRYEYLSEIVEASDFEWLKLVEHKRIETFNDLLGYEAVAVERGYEGVMLRDPNGAYKCGRSTMREQGLIKFKRWQDAEATVLDVIEQQTNLNPAKRNALGLTERSTSKAGKKGAGTAGALLCEWQVNGKPSRFTVGVKDVAMGKAIWADKAAYIGQPLKIRFQGLTRDGAPRFPIALGFRSPIDMEKCP